MRVIKLGGSLLSNNRLRACLAQIASNQTSTLVVTGGGVFAEQVRLAQQQWQFDEVAAHHMAILAMQQMALLVNALHPNWDLLQSLDDLKSWSTQNKNALWLPDIKLLNAHAIPATWRITSDSLAAWVSGLTGATELIIVKAAQIAPHLTLADLSALGILDDAFLEFVDALSFTPKVIHCDNFIQDSL